MSRRVIIRKPGGPEALEVVSEEVPEPGAGQVRVRHTAIGLNFIDTYHRSGLYPLPSLPHGLGTEAAGIVEAVGDGVDGLEVGMRVAYAGGPPGSYTEARTMPADRLVPVPVGVTDEQAAATMLKGMTVEYLTYRCAPVEEGMMVLWHAAAGGVGSIACQWLAARGVKVIGTAGSDDKVARALELGCAHGIDYRQEDFAERVDEITGGRGVPIVFDAVGKATFEGSLKCLARRGTMVSFGNASGAPDPFDPLELSRGGSLYLTRPSLFDYTATRAELLESAGRVFEAIERGHFAVDIGQRWPLENAADAHRALEARETRGPSILVPAAG